MKVIRADKDEMNFEHSPKVKAALKTIDQDNLKRYEKEPKLLEALSKKHKVPKERVFLENGVIGVIHRVYDHMLTSNSKVLIPSLGYPYFKKLAKNHKAGVLSFKFTKGKDGFEYDIKDLLKKLKQKPEVLVIIDPESPLGFSIKEKELEKILSKVNEETLVFLDQSHEGFRERHIKDVSKLIKKHPNLLVARGFSKFYGLAGMRIAYVLCGKEVKKMINYKEKYLGFNNVAQRIAETALESEEHYKENASKIKKEKIKFMKAMRELPGYNVINTDSSSVIVEVPEKHNEIERLAKESGILVRDLESYHEDLKNHFRITMGPKENTKKLIEFFQAVSWLYNLNVLNAETEAVFNTRSAGYTVHRAHLPCKKANLTLGWHRVLMPPGTVVSEHYHLEQNEQFEFFTNATVRINGKEHKIKPGQIVNVNPGDKHEVIAPGNQFVRFTALRYPYSLEDKYTSDGKKKVHKESNP